LLGQRKFFIVRFLIFTMANRIGDKELKTDWDARTAADSSKAPGYDMALIPQESLVPARKRVGLD